MENMKKVKYNLHIIGDYNNKKILLIHGMGFYWENCFSNIVKELKERYCILIPELSGHAPNSEGYVNSVSSSAEQILRELTIKEFNKIDCIYGISLGASIALEIAMNNKISINKLILDGGQFESMEDKKCEYARIISEEFKKIIEGKHMSSYILEQMGYLTNNDINVLKPLMYLDVSFSALYKAALAAYSYDIREREEKLNMNVIIMFGGNEIYAKRSISYIEDKCIKPLTICDYPNRGHAEVLSKAPHEICKIIER